MTNTEQSVHSHQTVGNVLKAHGIEPPCRDRGSQIAALENILRYDDEAHHRRIGAMQSV